MNFYNEIDPSAAAWIRELIKRGLIPNGVVDERSITEIKPHELAGFTQCHFFSGISGWSLALRLAGWPEDRRVWTGSCPCQPFSAAGKGRGTEDERHLWPVFFKLIEACRPEFVFGEQVASAAVVGSASGKAQLEPEVPVWLDGVFADLEGASYACAAADIPAAGVGAPHIRQRLFWGAADGLANPGHESTWRSTGSGEEEGGRSLGEPTGRGDANSRMGHAHHARPQGHNGHGDNGSQPGRLDAEPVRSTRAAGGIGERLGDTTSSRRIGSEQHPEGEARFEARVQLPCADGKDCGMADTDGGDSGAEREQRGGEQRQQPQDNRLGDWGDYQLIYCRDNKYRRVPVESLTGFQPLVDARIYLVPGVARRGSVRPALLKGSGNAIVPEAAAKFVKAFERSVRP